MQESDYYVFFSYSQGIGPKTFIKLLSYFKTAKNIYYASEEELEKAGLKGKSLDKYLEFKSKFNLQEVLTEIKHKKIWVLAYSDFPESLRNISNPPIVLYGRGDKDLLMHENGIGIVGSRRPTSYGISVTKGFTRDLVESGITIISGMALGVDAVAHRACMGAKGKTVAVLGSGVDVPTPSEHFNLYNEIITSSGAIVSEFPLGMMPNKGSFPARNRIIAGLSKAVLITEATSDSGALITAKEAFSQGRKVYIVPGPITSNLSKGTNSLINKGGIAVGSAEEIIKDLGNNVVKNKVSMEISDPLLRLIQDEPRTTSELARISKLSINEINSQLTDLELSGKIIHLNGKWELLF